MQRPPSIIIFGILNFVFAALGVIGLIASFSLFSVPVNSSDSVIKLIHQGPAYTFWLKLCIPLGILNCLLLLAAGIGLLSFKPWARPLSIAWATYSIVFVAAALGINLCLMVQPFFDHVGHQQQFEAAAAIGGPLSGTVGSIFWIVYPVVLLVFMLLSKVKAAFVPLVSSQT